MKQKLKIFISCLAVVALILSMLGGLGRLTQRKASQEKYHDFFREEGDFDVLFLGSSHMMNAVYPMELWNDYGIVSYNMGGHASTLCVSYWVLQNALDYTTPKVVVIDAMGISNDYKVHDTFEYMHHTFDSFPLSINKIRAVYDLVEESEPGAGDKLSRQMEILWDFTTYHNRWSELGQNDFLIDASPEKGGEMRVAVATPAEIPTVSPDRKYQGNDYGKQYLERIIQDCQSRGIQVLLTFIPFPPDERRIMEANAIHDIAEAYGVEYINFLEEGTVNFLTDCFDAGSHLNTSGARKVTSYLGSVLRDRYDIPDQRENPLYAHWHQDHEEFMDYKLELLQSQTLGYRYLMMLSDDDFSFVLELDRWGRAHSEKYLALLKNMGIDPEQANEDVRYVVADRAAGTIEYVSLTDLRAGPVETSLGTLTMETGEEDYQLLLNGQPCLTGDIRNGSNYDYRAAVYSREGELLDFQEMYLN